MNLHWIDWSIMAAMLAVILITAIVTRRLTRSVADFLTANRSAGRYLLCISSGIAGIGAISVVAKFEMYYEAGFTASWWILMTMPMAVLIALSGWVIYRYRETRAMTLAQFFQMRYSRNFRVCAGIIAWVSGIINFGIFPAVGARFFVYFLGLPNPTVSLLGQEVGATYLGVMVLLLAIAVFLVFMGGQVAVMLTDFIQGMLTNIAFLIILVVVFGMIDWGDLIHTLQTAAPSEASRLHPFQTSAVKGFNGWFFLIALTVGFYGAMAWQGSQAYRSAPKSAHEAKMAGILGEWRGLVFTLLVMMLPVAAWVIMHHPDFVDVQTQVNQSLTDIPNPTISKQMTVPIILAHALPTGVIGILAAVMLAAFISTHDTYLHSWGSIFIQDVVLPFRKKPFTTRQHLWLLRGSILFVAIFIFIFSIFFDQNDYIMMFFAITGAIYVGGAGACIIGGLYWKHGSTAGAWAALCTGSITAVLSVVARQLWPGTIYPWLEERPGLLQAVRTPIEGVADAVPGINWTVNPDTFPLDGQWMAFFTVILAVCIYVGCSLFTWLVLKHPPHNMDKLLHRGEYVVTGDHEQGVVKPTTGWRALLPTEEFTLGDKFIYYGKLIWCLGWFAIFLVGSLYNLAYDVPVSSWVTFWGWRIGIIFVLGIGTTIWFTIGGIIDARDLFKTLGSANRDYGDTGMVEEESDDKV